jgi:hypothetical protein
VITAKLVNHIVEILLGDEHSSFISRNVVVSITGPDAVYPDSDFSYYAIDSEGEHQNII